LPEIHGPFRNRSGQGCIENKRVIRRRAPSWGFPWRAAQPVAPSTQMVRHSRQSPLPIESSPVLSQGAWEQPPAAFAFLTVDGTVAPHSDCSKHHRRTNQHGPGSDEQPTHCRVFRARPGAPRFRAFCPGFHPDERETGVEALKLGSSRTGLIKNRSRQEPVSSSLKSAAEHCGEFLHCSIFPDHLA
jgi:hypothetical protein